MQIRLYDIIYDALDEVKAAMAGLLAPIKREVAMGKLQVRETFSIPKVGTVAGCMVTDGKINRKAHLRIIRDAIQKACPPHVRLIDTGEAVARQAMRVAPQNTRMESPRPNGEAIAYVTGGAANKAAMAPADIRTAVLYDHFTPYVLIQLEELGFCKRGEARHFIADGAIELDGRLPVNPHGGQLGEAYIHGMNGIAEGVRQVRGTSVNQVPDADHVLVTAGTGVPTSGLILSK